MKTTFLALLAVLLGVVLGLGTARLRIESALWTPDSDKERESPATPPRRPKGPAPKVVVDLPRFDFGSLDVAAQGSHDFVFHNRGEAPLKLTPGGTTCSCTMSKLGDDVIPPGGSTTVTITWNAKDKPGPYEQAATILTNDPNRPRVTLTVSGRITVAAQIYPEELVFSRLTVTEASTAQAWLYCFIDKPLTILGHECSDPATARFLDVATRSLTVNELKEGPPDTRNGVLITVTVKPGLPQGPLRQRIIFHTNIASLPTLTLPVQGIVGGEIGIAGRGWNNDTGILTLGTVSSREGVQQRLMLVVRGPSRQKVTFQVARVEPEMLKVSLGQPTEINHGVVVQTPLIIGIPRGSPTVNRLGSDQGSLGKIILKTTHPQIHEVQIFVRFAVEK